VQSQFFRFICLFLLLFLVAASAKSTEHWQIDRWHYEPRSYQALAKESLLTQTDLLSHSQKQELYNNLNINVNRNVQISINNNSKLLNKHVGYSEKNASKDISASNDDNFAFTPSTPQLEQMQNLSQINNPSSPACYTPSSATT
jgi:hypothetical protein